MTKSLVLYAILAFSSAAAFSQQQKAPVTHVRSGEWQIDIAGSENIAVGSIKSSWEHDGPYFILSGKFPKGAKLEYDVTLIPMASATRSTSIHAAQSVISNDGKTLKIFFYNWRSFAGNHVVAGKTINGGTAG